MTKPALHYFSHRAYPYSMRAMLLLTALAFLLIESGGFRQPVVTTASSATSSRIDFDTQIKPIFESKCMPCHFSGGAVYERLPFDKPGTIRKLGTKLFTRIKNEDDRKLIEQFLAQSP